MKKFVSVLLTLCLLIGTLSVGMTSFAAKAAADRKTTVIVKLKGDGVLRAEAAGENAVSAQSDAVFAQQEVQSAIEDKIGAVDALYSYTHVLNGFAAEVRAGDIDAIRKLPGVAGVYETAGVRPQIEKVSAAGEISSGAMIGLEDAREMGYDGKGTAIAVIDGGFDVNAAAMRLSDDSTAKYSKEDVAAVLRNNQMNCANVTADDVYHNAKIPFAYDYRDQDTILLDNNESAPDHGTHVSGIAAGNSDKLTGIAPEAQVLMFKISVYDDESFLANMLAAVDDAAKFDIAAMNLSVGMDGEVAGNPAYDLLQEVFSNARAAGILVCTAAGNAGRFSNYVETADNGTNGIPNGFAAATSVASVDNVYLSDRIGIVPENLVYDGGKKVSVNGYGLLQPFPQEPLPIVPMGKNKATGDLSGGAALIYLSQSNYKKALKSILSSDAKLVIVCESALEIFYYDQEHYDLFMQVVEDYPLVGVADLDAYRLYHAKDRQVSIELSDGFYAEPADTLRVSEFSSWGISEEGNMTVDIAAPGGVIYSSVLGGNYDVYNGTSMATPHICGVGALLSQHFAKVAPSVSGKEKSDLMENLLMSTADPVPIGDSLTPVRAVGAGLVDLTRALSANAVLTDQNNHSALNLGDKLSREVKMTFTVKNFSAKSVRYDTLKASVNSDEYSVERTFNENTGKYDEQYTTTGSGAALGFTLQSDLPRSFTLGPGETRDVTLTITIDEADFDRYAQIFTSGFFVDGYLFLSDSVSGNTTLNIPFLGFVGDWDAVPALMEQESWYGEKFMTVVRSLRSIRYVLTDAEGNVIGESTSDEIMLKGTMLDSYAYMGQFPDVADGEYNLTVYAVPYASKDDAGQAFDLGLVHIDSNPPKIVSVRKHRNPDGSGTITITMREPDTAYFAIYGAMLINSGFVDLYPGDTYDSIDAKGNYVYEIHEDKLPIGLIYVEAYDYNDQYDSYGFKGLLGTFSDLFTFIPNLLLMLFLSMIYGLSI